MERSRPPPISPLTGARLGRYFVGPRLGSGGAASVYLALLTGPLDFDRVLALKVVHEHLLESKEFVDMFLDEARLAVRLTHPNIVHAYELGRDGPSLFLAMEYLAGQPLSRVIERVRERGERLSPLLVAWIGARAAQALAHAHALRSESGEKIGLVHRDVSPQNVFLTYDGRVVLIDFGIARADGRVTHTGMGRIKGKVAYMAPEQLLRGEVDHRADLFALGTTLYEVLAGRRPFEAADEASSLASLLEDDVPSLAPLHPDVSQDLSDIVGRALRREASQRPSGAEEMARVLDRVASGSSEPSAALAQLLTRLFEREKAEGQRAVAELRAACTGTGARVPLEATRTVDSMATTIRPVVPAGSRRGLLWAGLAAGALLGVAGVLLLLPRNGEPRPVVAAPAAPPEVPRALPTESSAAPTMPAPNPALTRGAVTPAVPSTPPPRAKAPGEATPAPRRPTPESPTPESPAPTPPAPTPEVEPGLVKEYPF